MKPTFKVLPRILVIDDMFGRTYKGTERNQAREGLCSKYSLDENDKKPGLRVKEPLAEAVFCRAQTPVRATIGDTVENDLEGCLQTIEAGWNVTRGALPWSLILLDLCFYTGAVTQESNQRNPGMPEGRAGDDKPENYFGLTLLQTIQKRFPDLPVIILSSMSREEISKQFSTSGALGFLDRVSNDSPVLLRQYLWRHGLIPDHTGTIIGNSKPLLFTLRKARRIAISRQNTLLRGPRGSGKGLIARYIHASSGKETTPFVPVNLGGANPNLYESLLFGHVKGAFTGADSQRKGAIEEANTGTLFIDEIAGISDQIQYGLLRVLEDKKIFRLGSNEGKNVNVHFISATNEDIEARASNNKGFRSDLLDRIRKGGTLHIPNLANRKEDIPLLADHFVSQAEAQYPEAQHKQVDYEVYKKLSAYDWPGNIRQLEQCIFEAVGENLDVEHLVANHIRLPDAAGDTVEQIADNTAKPISGQKATSLDELLQVLSEFNFSSLGREEMSGRLEEMDTSCQLFKAHYLQAALEKTRTPIDSEIQITPAMKMATGNVKLKTSKAADVIKRLLKGLDCSNPDEQILKQALERAIELRPTRKVEK